jgi:predicted RNase H-like nuclease
MDDWQSVCRCLLETASDFELPTEAADCIKRLAELSAPRKRDQDQLDSLICLLMALFWCDRPEASIVIGDVTNGYIVTAATAEVRRRLELAAHDRSVPIDGTIPGR